MSTNSNPVVRVNRRIPFPAERVFDAWLDPARAAKWLFTTPTGQIVRAEIDPRVGGRYTFTDRRDGQDIEHTGEYLEINRPHRLVFTLGVPKFSPGFDRIAIEIVPQSDGCELSLTHELSPEWADYAGRTENGWAQILEGLAANLGDERAATNIQPGQFIALGEVRFVRLLPGPIERVWAYLTDGEKRAKWFAGGPMELRAGGRVELFFRHANLAPDETPPEQYKQYHDPGDTMIAEVTQCDPPKLLSFTWPGATPDETSEVSFELTPHGENVQLVLTHRRLGSKRDELISVSSGWHTHLRHLEAQLAGTKPPPFWAPLAQFEADYAKRLEQFAP